MINMNKQLPNLFIGGAQKSGTTSLHYFLGKHPDIFIPNVPEELHFFDIDENYDKGLDWYLTYFSPWQGEPIIAQTSPLYLYQPEVPKRIYQFNPEAKFIFILRNPIERAYSHYWNSVRYGYESLSFEEALEQEEERIEQNSDFRRKYSYIDRGRYTEQILRFLELFPRENILILLFDDLKKSYVDIGKICGYFLEIDSGKFIYPEQHNSVKNKAQIPRFSFLQNWISKQYERQSKQGEISIPIMVRFLEKVNLKNLKYPSMSEEVKSKLLQYFESEIVALQGLVNIDLQAWFD